MDSGQVFIGDVSNAALEAVLHFHRVDSTQVVEGRVCEVVNICYVERIINDGLTAITKVQYLNPFEVRRCLVAYK